MPPLVRKKLPDHGNVVFNVTTPPSTEPITAAEVRSHLRVDSDSEDTYIETLITAVREMAEKWLGRALITQTITANFDWWPEVVKLPRPPLISVTSVHTIDEQDDETEYSSDNYYVRTDVQPGQILIRDGVTPPINTDRYYGGFKVVYQAGYGEDAADVPGMIRMGLIEWVAHAFENRTIDREPPVDSMALLGGMQIRRM